MKIPAPTKIQDAPKGSKDMADPNNDDYETKGNLDTLMKAHAIMSHPPTMAKVHALAGRHKKAITSIQDIKDHYNTKFGPGAKKQNALVASPPAGDGEPTETPDDDATGA